MLALGATFSALEIVPLVLIGFEGYENLTLSRARPWVSAYKWPIYFFVAVAFWNLVGAGLFGFLINPPIGLYYMQGFNTTPVHAHTALFGVYPAVVAPGIQVVDLGLFRKFSFCVLRTPSQGGEDCRRSRQGRPIASFRCRPCRGSAEDRGGA